MEWSRRLPETTPFNPPEKGTGNVGRRYGVDQSEFDPLCTGETGKCRLAGTARLCILAAMSLRAIAYFSAAALLGACERPAPAVPAPPAPSAAGTSPPAAPAPPAEASPPSAPGNPPAAPSVPAVELLQQRVAVAKARRGVVVLRNAVQQYFAEYDRLPLSGDAPQHAEIRLTTGAADSLAAILSGRDAAANAKSVNFIDSLETGPDGSISDPWENPYIVIFDADYDQQITSPDPAASVKVLPGPALIFSPGPDKNPDTWTDNIKSWE